MQKIQEQDVRGKRVLVRIDVDDAREHPFQIEAIMPTAAFLKESGARTIFLTHVGRDPEASAEELYAVFSRRIPSRFVPDLTGAQAHGAVAQMKDGDVILLENVRRDPREAENDDAFAQELASLADMYVNEAFSVSHREHASVVGVPKYLPAFAGMRLQQEMKALSGALSPEAPGVFVLSGAKIETKLPLIEKFAKLYDSVFVGGVLANNFLKEKGIEVGVSVVSESDVDISSLLHNAKISLPIDVIVEKDGESRVCAVADVEKDEKIVDAGPETISILGEKIEVAKTVVWNGPLGEYEKGYADATRLLAKKIAESDAKSIVGGGDTVAALDGEGVEKNFSFLSTGGGAMLEFLEKGTLPGIEALR